jgi:hypothetical protein
MTTIPMTFTRVLTAVAREIGHHQQDESYGNLSEKQWRAAEALLWRSARHQQREWKLEEQLNQLYAEIIEANKKKLNGHAV